MGEDGFASDFDRQAHGHGDGPLDGEALLETDSEDDEETIRRKRKARAMKRKSALTSSSSSASSSSASIHQRGIGESSSNSSSSNSSHMNSSTSLHSLHSASHSNSKQYLHSHPPHMNTTVASTAAVDTSSRTSTLDSTKLLSFLDELSTHGIGNSSSGSSSKHASTFSPTQSKVSKRPQSAYAAGGRHANLSSNINSTTNGRVGNVNSTQSHAILPQTSKSPRKEREQERERESDERPPFHVDISLTGQRPLDPPPKLQVAKAKVSQKSKVKSRKKSHGI
jgi:hypothetical protein